jgi:tetratricopeptide (TPR) repeat protein
MRGDTVVDKIERNVHHGRQSTGSAYVGIRKALNNLDWKRAQQLSTKTLQVLAKSDSNRHWFYVARAFSYFKQNRFAGALADSRAALSIAPNCPEAIQVHVLVLNEYGRLASVSTDEARLYFEEAVSWGNKLIRRGIKSIMNDPCAPRTVVAASKLLNDTSYFVGFAYWNLNERRKAQALIDKYIQTRRANPRVRSMCSLTQAKAELKRLELELHGSRSNFKTRL